MNAPKGKYAWSATVGEKGQIVIPKQARELFSIRPGDTLIILGDEARGLAIPRGEALNAFIDTALGGIAPNAALGGIAPNTAPDGGAAPSGGAAPGGGAVPGGGTVLGGEKGGGK